MVRARTISAAASVSIRSRRNTTRNARRRLAHPHRVPPAQVLGLQRGCAAGPNEGHDRGGEGDPVGSGQPCVPPGEDRRQEDPRGQRGCAGHQHHRSRRRDITPGIAGIVRNWKQNAAGWPMPSATIATPNHAVTAAYSHRISGPRARATAMPPRPAAAGRGDAVAGRVDHEAPDAAPPQHGSELSQVSPCGSGCDLGNHSSLWTASCA